MRVLKTDPRAQAHQSKLPAPAPLPHVSSKALAKVAHRLNPPTHCDCCGAPGVKLVDNSEIYKRQYGDWPYAYLCGKCGAYVGLHPHTDLPLGTMADKATRKARQQKRQFLALIESKFCGDRDAGYAWLAEKMGLDPKECHWGLFTLKQCEQAAQIVKEAEQ
jgi:hypothetical protein